MGIAGRTCQNVGPQDVDATLSRVQIDGLLDAADRCGRFLDQMR